MESIHAFSVFSIGSVAAHGADLLVDVTVAVDIVLLSIPHINPSEYRIVNLTGVAVIRIVSACRCAWLRGGRWFFSGLRYGGFIFRLIVGISKIILCFGRRIRFS